MTAPPGDADSHRDADTTKGRPPDGCTVLVTGATGFVGRTLVPRLLERGWNVRALRRTGVVPPEWLHPDARCDSGRALEIVDGPDIVDATISDWVGLLEGSSAVVHLAGIAHASRSIDESRYQGVNARAVETLGHAAKAVGARMVFLSSVRAQAGPTATKSLSETDTPAPMDTYGRAKLAGEQTLQEVLRSAVILRPVVIYGPQAKGNLALLQRLADLPIPLPLSFLEARRSVLGIENLCSAVSWALTSGSGTGNAEGGCYLLADPGEPPRVQDLVRWLREAAGRRAGLFPLPEKLLALAATMTGKGEAWQRIAGSLIVDTTRITAAGWKPIHDTPTGVRQMVTGGA